MAGHRFFGIVLGVFLVGGFVASPRFLESAALAAPASAPPDEDLNSKGVAQRIAGNNRGALELFQQAYDMTHSPRATAQLGLVQQALGRWELAEPLVAKSLQSRDDLWIKKYEVELKRALETIRDHVAHLELTSDPPQAEIVVNGSVAGHLPLTDPLPVVAGQVDLEVRAPGYRNAVRSLNVKAYQYERVFVRLEKEASAASSDPTASEPKALASHDSQPSQPAQPPASGGALARKIVKWSSLGLAGVSLGTGIVASIVHTNSVNDFTSVDDGNCRDDGGVGKDQTTGKPNQECQDPLNSYRNARTWQIVGFVGAGVFAATWLVLQLTESNDDATSPTHTASWTCVPAPTVGGAAASCALRF